MSAGLGITARIDKNDRKQYRSPEQRISGPLQAVSSDSYLPVANNVEEWTRAHAVYPTPWLRTMCTSWYLKLDLSPSVWSTSPILTGLDALACFRVDRQLFNPSRSGEVGIHFPIIFPHSLLLKSLPYLGMRLPAAPQSASVAQACSYRYDAINTRCMTA